MLSFGCSPAGTKWKQLYKDFTNFVLFCKKKVFHVQKNREKHNPFEKMKYFFQEKSLVVACLFFLTVLNDKKKDIDREKCLNFIFLSVLSTCDQINFVY